MFDSNSYNYNHTSEINRKESKTLAINSNILTLFELTAGVTYANITNNTYILSILKKLLAIEET